eukprot:1146670-Pyramimonas_sp.AAC.1
MAEDSRSNGELEIQSDGALGCLATVGALAPQSSMPTYFYDEPIEAAELGWTSTGTGFVRGKITKARQNAGGAMPCRATA